MALESTHSTSIHCRLRMRSGRRALTFVGHAPAIRSCQNPTTTARLTQNRTRRKFLGYVGSDQIGTISGTPKPSSTGLDANILLGVLSRKSHRCTHDGSQGPSLRNVVSCMLCRQLTEIGTAASVGVGDNAVTPGCLRKPT